MSNHLTNNLITLIFEQYDLTELYNFRSTIKEKSLLTLIIKCGKRLIKYDYNKCEATLNHISDVFSCLQLDNEYVVSSTYEGAIYLWNETFTLIKTIKLNKQTDLPIALPGSAFLAKTFFNLYQIDTNLNNIKCHNDALDDYCLWITSIIKYFDNYIFGYNGRMLVIDNQLKQVLAWSHETLNFYKISKMVHMDKNIIICGSGKEILLLRVRQGEIHLCGKFKGHEGNVLSLARIDDKHFASGSLDFFIKVWELEKNECSRTLVGHTDSVNALIRLTDIRMASGSADKTIRLWDISTFQCLRVLTGHSDGILCLVQLKNLKLMSGSRDKTIKIWS
jgi:WD40 repeat protein